MLFRRERVRPRPRGWLSKPTGVAIFLVNGLIGGPCSAKDLSFVVGGGGWRLERFGTDIAILRTNVIAPAPNDTPGFLLLSCEGAERRFRFQLPVSLLPSSGPTAKGYALIAAPGPPKAGVPPLVSAFSLEKGMTLVIAEPSSTSHFAVLRLSRLLQAKPSRLDFLLRFERRDSTLRAVVPLHLALVFGAQEAIVLNDFASTCASGRASEQ